MSAADASKHIQATRTRNVDAFRKCTNNPLFGLTPDSNCAAKVRRVERITILTATPAFFSDVESSSLALPFFLNERHPIKNRNYGRDYMRGPNTLVK